MSLTSPSQRLPDPPEIDPSDDYESLAMDACQLLSETDARFIISGFGQPEWPVDVSYDLSSVIEQLPAAIDCLQQGRDARIDLYGQGVERCLLFAPAGVTVEIRCVSGTTWRPDPDVEVMPRVEVLKHLTDLASEFGAALRKAAPEVAALTPFARW
ncbi:hypothetical protein ABZ318_03205 [Streptomyces sp. NPDC006197]|uniref:hypothetical protein n=1 Tax=Streptomyces sp. NPDC006197 TaxID=3156685 RepID=UPI0033B7CA5B